MSIKSGQGVTPTPIGTSDTTLLTSSAGQSKELYVLSIHNTASSPATVEIFLSADAVSASGERVEYEVIDAGETVPLSPRLIPATFFYIGKSDIAGVAFTGIYTLRNGTDT